MTPRVSSHSNMNSAAALSAAVNKLVNGNVLQQHKVNHQHVISVRKNLHQQHILPAPKDVLLSNTARKKMARGSAGSVKEAATSRLQNPPPVAVARRNARERNRVKQVNNGFATLRQHIPNNIAAAFESSNGRGGNKKLSKVETLRMAVEYIRSLEDLLSVDENDSAESTASSSPQSQAQANINYSYPIMSPSADDDDLSTNPTPSPPAQQFLSRIPGTNTYQIITTHMYDDSENLEPLEVDEELLTDPSLMDAEFVHDLSILNSMHTTASLSPEVYSDHSMSPCGVDAERVQHQQPFIPIFATNAASMQTPSNLKLRLSPNEEAKLVSALGPPVISLPAETVLSLDQHSVLDVMAWWDQQQVHHNQKS